MSLLTFRLLTDVSFFIFIWAVQLIIYPSFRYYSETNLNTWHPIYTQRVTFIVAPLMFSQLGASIWHLWQVQNWYTILSFIFVIFLWVHTFGVFIPLHGKIDNTTDLESVTKALVQKNWIRTLVWSLLFLVTFVYFINVGG